MVVVLPKNTDDCQHVWVSKADDTFVSVDEYKSVRGTDLKEDNTDFLDENHVKAEYTQIVLVKMGISDVHKIVSPLYIGVLRCLEVLVGMFTGDFLTGFLLGASIAICGGACENDRKFVEVEGSITDIANFSVELASSTHAFLPVRVDPEAVLVSFQDNGIGMSVDDLAGNMCTIVLSGSQRFTDAAEKSQRIDNFVGMFGIRFYSNDSWVKVNSKESTAGADITATPPGATDEMSEAGMQQAMWDDFKSKIATCRRPSYEQYIRAVESVCFV
eukprot:212881_1